MKKPCSRCRRRRRRGANASCPLRAAGAPSCCPPSAPWSPSSRALPGAAAAEAVPRWWRAAARNHPSDTARRSWSCSGEKRSGSWCLNSARPCAGSPYCTSGGWGLPEQATATRHAGAAWLKRVRVRCCCLRRVAEEVWVRCRCPAEHAALRAALWAWRSVARARPAHRGAWFRSVRRGQDPAARSPQRPAFLPRPYQSLRRPSHARREDPTLPPSHPPAFQPPSPRPPSSPRPPHTPRFPACPPTPTTPPADPPPATAP